MSHLSSLSAMSYVVLVEWRPFTTSIVCWYQLTVSDSSSCLTSWPLARTIYVPMCLLMQGVNQASSSCSSSIWLWLVFSPRVMVTYCQEILARMSWRAVGSLPSTSCLLLTQSMWSLTSQTSAVWSHWIVAQMRLQWWWCKQVLMICSRLLNLATCAPKTCVMAQNAAGLGWSLASVLATGKQFLDNMTACCFIWISIRHTSLSMAMPCLIS